jgi:hypothetical protein
MDDGGEQAPMGKFLSVLVVVGKLRDLHQPRCLPSAVWIGCGGTAVNGGGKLQYAGGKGIIGVLEASGAGDKRHWQLDGAFGGGRTGWDLCGGAGSRQWSDRSAIHARHQLCAKKLCLFLMFQWGGWSLVVLGLGSAEAAATTGTVGQCCRRQ